MPAISDWTRQERAAFVIILYVMGLVFLGAGILGAGVVPNAGGTLDVGIMLLALAFVVTLMLFPEVLKAARGIAKGIVAGSNMLQRFARKRLTQKTPPTEYPSTGEEVQVSSRQEVVSSLIEKMEGFSLSRSPRKEEQCEDMLASYLQAFYPQVKRQREYPDMRIDLVIDNIGIEIKFQPTAYDFHALYSQVEDRLKYLSSVIVAIFAERDIQATNKFRDKLRQRGWLNTRVFIVVKY
jgi:hypothetical protein